MAFQDTYSTKVGTKGSDVYTASGVEDPRVALSALLTRGAELSMLNDGLRAILTMKTENNQHLEDAFVLAFQTRDVRGGKGERKLFEYLFKLLLDCETRDIAEELLTLIPHYGCWRDLFALTSVDTAYEPIMEYCVRQYNEDTKLAAEGKPISLFGKWAPRESRHSSLDHSLCRDLAFRLNPQEKLPSRRLMKYRKGISYLNKHLKTVEIAMCGNNFESIEPSSVPGRALQKYTKAFLNQPSTFVKLINPRPSDDPDRIQCAEKFAEHFAKAAKGLAKVKGADTVYPHELIKKIVRNSTRECYYKNKGEDLVEDMYSSLTPEEKDSVVAVWNSMVAKAKEGGGLRKSLAMCDFSGSMQSSGTNGDTPYWVSMAMGLLISELTTEEFKDTFLTFDSYPTLHHLPEGDIFDRVASITSSLSQGTSTDFQKAMDLVLATLKEKRCKPGDEPEYLIVLTDMNWDAACGSHEASIYTQNRYRNVVKTDSWQTHVEMIRESFKRAGEDMWGEGQGWKMPTIVIWNIASTSTDFHAKADTPGVVMLSGWSPSLFKVLQTEGIVSWTPYQALRVQLDDERYDLVREKVRAVLAARG
jgi:hypothetical protein